VYASQLARSVDRETFPIFVLAGYAVVLLGALAPAAFGSDTWLTLVAGREIADHGVPHRDALAAWTAGREWIDQQWLAHLGGYALNQLGGPGALAVVNAAVAVSSLALALAGARRRGGSARSAALVAVVCAPALLPFAVIRPQTLSYPLFVGLFVLLEGARPGRRTLLCLPLLVLWANVHGSALLGAGVVTLWGLSGALWADGRFRLSPAWSRYAGLVTASWLCLLATPYTVSVVGYYGRILLNPAFGEVVTEWMRPSFPRSTPFFVLAAVAAALVVTPRPRYSLFARSVLAITTLAGFTAIRYAVWLPLLVAVLAPAALDAVWPPRAVERHVRVNLALVTAALIGVAVVAGLAASKPGSSYERPLRPEAARAARAAAERTGGVVFADSALADWLIWREPALRRRIAFDVRFELLTAQELRRLGAFFSRSGRDWRSAAACCRVIVLRTDQEVTQVLRRELQVTYADDETTVLVRRMQP
jgi:hypothetical protein